MTGSRRQRRHGVSGSLSKEDGGGLRIGRPIPMRRRSLKTHRNSCGRNVCPVRKFYKRFGKILVHRLRHFYLVSVKGAALNRKQVNFVLVRVAPVKTAGLLPRKNAAFYVFVYDECLKYAASHSVFRELAFGFYSKQIAQKARVIKIEFGRFYKPL